MSPAPWLTDPALARVWAVLRERLEARGLRVEGRVVLRGLSRAERHAASALVGRPVTTARLVLDLAELDAGLAARSGVGGLRAVVEEVTGAALRDRPALRARQVADREAPYTVARALVTADPVLAQRPWVPDWLAGLRRSGVLARTSEPVSAVRHAVAALHLLLGAQDPTSRTELAVAAAGGAHGLDDGTVAAALVLRALAAQAGERTPVSAAGRRALWERFGVRVDAVSTTCLTLGLRGVGGAVAARLDLAAAAGDPVHLTPWDLRRCVLAAPETVLVCENPRVLEAVAQRCGGRRAVVCTSGQPALVVLDVLHALADAQLRYHGDFDWPGIAIANRLVAAAGVTPWRMGVAQYVAALGPARLQLSGAAVEAAWDPELGPAMLRHGVAVHEEAVLDDLLAALD